MVVMEAAFHHGPIRIRNISSLSVGGFDAGLRPFLNARPPLFRGRTAGMEVRRMSWAAVNQPETQTLVRSVAAIISQLRLHLLR